MGLKDSFLLIAEFAADLLNALDGGKLAFGFLFSRGLGVTDVAPAALECQVLLHTRLNTEFILFPSISVDVLLLLLGDGSDPVHLTS